MPTNREIVEAAYVAAEAPIDVETFISLFAEQGYLNDVSAARKYHGREVGELVKNVISSFPDMHRELQRIVVQNETVVVELSLNGTHAGPLETRDGTVPPSGRKVEVPCCDVWTLRDGKIQSFHCYTATQILFDQIR